MTDGLESQGPDADVVKGDTPAGVLHTKAVVDVGINRAEIPK